MARSNFHNRFLAKISEVIESRSAQIASGTCTSYEHYRKEVGYIEGLTDALKYADDVAKELD